MKTNQWLSPALLVALGIAGSSVSALSLSAIAAESPNTNKTDKAEAPKTFVPEPAVAKQNNVNVRAQAAIGSEIVTHLQKGQAVTVLEEVTLKKPKTDEPATWFRILLPTNTTAWVSGEFINASNKTVKPKRLNFRAGPSEDYSILGRLEQGAVVTVLADKNGWLKIETPADAHGFVAAHLLSKEPPSASVAAVKPPTEIKPVVVITPSVVAMKPVEEVKPVVTEVKPPEVVVVAKAPEVPVVAATNVPAAPVAPPPPIVVAAAPAAPAPVAPSTNLAGATLPAPVVAEPPIKRVVTREGRLKGMTSIQAPSFFELRSLDNNHLIEYVWSPNTNILVKPFKGKKVFVTGEELLDERWPNTPVIKVESIEEAP